MDPQFEQLRGFYLINYFLHFLSHSPHTLFHGFLYFLVHFGVWIYFWPLMWRPPCEPTVLSSELVANLIVRHAVSFIESWRDTATTALQCQLNQKSHCNAMPIGPETTLNRQYSTQATHAPAFSQQQSISNKHKAEQPTSSYLDHHTITTRTALFILWAHNCMTRFARSECARLYVCLLLGFRV